MKKISDSKKKPTRLLTVLTCLVLVVTITADVLMFGVFAGSLDKAFAGSERDQHEIDASYQNGLAVARRIEEEGAVLLENNGGLPLAASNRKINLLGYGAASPVYGGSGSGGSTYTANRTDFVTAFTDAGFEVNPALVKLYASVAEEESSGVDTIVRTDFTIKELAATEKIADSLKQDFKFSGDCSFEALKAYSETAVIVFSRKGGEGNDLPTSMSKYTNRPWTYRPDLNRHYLELTSAEQALLEQAKATFNNVIVLINSGNAMELGFLENETVFGPDQPGDVDAAIWMGNPGDVGTRAIVDILTGKVNPSGRLPDIYPYAAETAPSFYNFDTYEYTNSGDALRTLGGGAHAAYLIQYQEGIYVGYRYYETRERYDYTTLEGEQFTGLSYDDVVQYPFGYGLSYTSFDWAVTATDTSTITENDTLRFDVTVTNTGSVAGKDVVELYYTAPYYSAAQGGSGIQKAGVVLGAFAKTGEIQPGKSETVTLELPVVQMASYDDLRCYSATGAYVLEAGDYTVSIRSDSHTVKGGAYTYTLAQNVVFTDAANASGAANCSYVGKRISDVVTAQNLFDDTAGDVTYLNRDTWEIVAGSDKEATEEQLNALRNALVIDECFVDPDDVAPIFGASNGITLEDMRGLAYDDSQWSAFLDQLTFEDINNILGANGWGSAAAESIGKPQTFDMDGPAALSYALDSFIGSTYKTVSYPCQVLMAATWNVDLATDFGDAISKEGKAWGISGWYAPGLNTHRTPFTGRNFEYYSEDGYLAGSMAAHVIAKAQENGMYCYMKHFALNERETNRNMGLCTWASEQAMREIYLVPFEMAVKDGGSTAVMSAYNNLGATWAGASKALLTDLLRGEWGFIGTVLTDNYEDHGIMDIEQAILAGGTSLLYGLGVKPLGTLNKTASGQLKMREAAHQYLYTIANSYVTELAETTPVWRAPAIAVSAAAYVLVIAGVAVIIRRKRKA